MHRNLADSFVQTKLTEANLGLFYLHSRYFKFYFDLVSSVLALEATKPLSEQVAQMALELINNFLISVHQKR